MKVLADWLDKKGLTQQQFAQQIGVKQPTLSAYITGKHGPSRRMLLVIASKTGLSVKDLVESAETEIVA